MDQLCMRCRGKGWCGKKCKILEKAIDFLPRIKEHFSGASPPEVFVGRTYYPHVFCGILSPNESGDTSKMSFPEIWVKENLSIEEILTDRSKMIYARNKTNIKTERGIKKVIQELALSSKPVSTEFFLERKPSLDFSASKIFSIMANPAPLKKAVIEENVQVSKKVEYLVSDTDLRAVDSINELYAQTIETSHIQKLFSTGLLGLKSDRKMVPTRWSITAVDDIIGKEILKKIRSYPLLNDFLVFSQDYNGNHFEVILLPGSFEFEVIEVSFSEGEVGFVTDHETFFGRKNYAANVVGAYYADRLATSEYLEKIKRQSKVLIFHEEREEYYAPLGVGIIRESLRKAMTNSYKRFGNLNEALEDIKSRIKFDIESYKENSKIIKEYGKQKSILDFI